MFVVSCTDVYAQKVGDTDHGRVGIDESIYWIDNHKKVLVDISGECYNNTSQHTKIEISVTYPDSTTKIYEVNSTKKCKFVLPIALDSDAQIGRHKVSAVGEGHSLGNAYFETRISNSINNVKQNIPNNITTNTVDLLVMTDMESYKHGSSIRVYGNISPVTHDKIPLILVIKDSLNTIVAIDQFETDINGEFSKDIKTGGNLWGEGEYIVKINHQETYAETNFSLMPKTHYTFTIKMDLVQDNHLFDFSLSEFQMKDNVMRFENSDGQTVHVYDTGYDIKYLFSTLNMFIDDNCIVSANGIDFCAGSDYNLQFKINGRVVTQLDNYIPVNNDHITVILTSNPQTNIISAIPQPNTPSTSNPKTTQTIKGTSNISAQSNTPPTLNPNTVVSTSSSNQLTMMIQSQSGLWIVLILLAVIIIFAIVMAKKRGNTAAAVQRPKKILNNSGNIIQFYECPKCYDPDIQNRSDGSVYCSKCKFRM